MNKTIFILLIGIFIAGCIIKPGSIFQVGTVNCIERYDINGSSRGCCCDGQINTIELQVIHRCNY